MANIFYLIRSDYRRYIATGSPNSWNAFTCQGLWASVIYRFANAVYFQFKIPFFRNYLLFFLAIASKVIEILTGISLPKTAQIGEGLYIGHFGPVILNPNVKIGDNCNLSQCVTIGKSFRGKKQGVPVIGNRVYIGPNSVIFGNIMIGDDAVIGAGSVVLDSVPSGCVVAGNPAHVISDKGSFDIIFFDGMEEDEQRKASKAKTAY